MKIYEKYKKKIKEEEQNKWYTNNNIYGRVRGNIRQDNDVRRWSQAQPLKHKRRPQEVHFHWIIYHK